LRSVGVPWKVVALQPVLDVDVVGNVVDTGSGRISVHHRVVVPHNSVGIVVICHPSGVVPVVTLIIQTVFAEVLNRVAESAIVPPVEGVHSVVVEVIDHVSESVEVLIVEEEGSISVIPETVEAPVSVVEEGVAKVHVVWSIEVEFIIHAEVISVVWVLEVASVSISIKVHQDVVVRGIVDVVVSIVIKVHQVVIATVSSSCLVVVEGAEESLVIVVYVEQVVVINLGTEGVVAVPVVSEETSYVVSVKANVVVVNVITSDVEVISVGVFASVVVPSVVVAEEVSVVVSIDSVGIDIHIGPEVSLEFVVVETEGISTVWASEVSVVVSISIDWHGISVVPVVVHKVGSGVKRLREAVSLVGRDLNILTVEHFSKESVG